MFDFFNVKKSYENVSTDAFKKLFSEHPNAVILDVRTKEEFKQGAIRGAVNLGFDWWEFQTRNCKNG